MAKTTKKETNKNVMNENVAVEFTPLSFEELKEKIEVRKFIGVLSKQTMIDVIYNSCVKLDDKNGVYYIDHIMKNVAYNFAMLEQYTNFYYVVENAQEYSYEYLTNIGMFDYVYTAVVADLVEVDEMIYDFGARVADLNSVGSCVYRLIGEGIKNMPKLDVSKVLKEIPQVINGIDKDIIKAVVGEFKSGNGKNIINRANAK